MNIIYTAKRNLISGHSADTEYEFDVNVSGYDRTSKPNSETSVSIDQSAVQTLLHGIEESYAIRTIPLPDTSTKALQMREFLDSVVSGEDFTVDLYGTVSTIDDPIIVTLSGDYTESRVSMHNIIFSFSVRKAL